MSISSAFVRVVFVVGLLVQVPDAFVGNLLPRRIPAAVVERFDLADNIWGMNNRKVIAENGNLTLRETQSLAVPTPSFVHILTQGILTITSFSILRKGSIFKYDYSRNTGDDQQQTQVAVLPVNSFFPNFSLKPPYHPGTLLLLRSVTFVLTLSYQSSSINPIITVAAATL